MSPSPFLKSHLWPLSLVPLTAAGCVGRSWGPVITSAGGAQAPEPHEKWGSNQSR